MGDRCAWVAMLWPMGKPKWWVCQDCKSLNDIPANKCYKCRARKPSDPALIDDQYEQLGGGSHARVGVSVDRSQVGSLVAPDPSERAQGGGTVMDAYNVPGDQRDHPERPPEIVAEPVPAPPPIRPPKPRSIAEVGGLHWSEEAEAEARAHPRVALEGSEQQTDQSPPPGSSPPPPAQAPPAHAPGPGQLPPPAYAPSPAPEREDD